MLWATNNLSAPAVSVAEERRSLRAGHVQWLGLRQTATLPERPGHARRGGVTLAATSAAGVYVRRTRHGQSVREPTVRVALRREGRRSDSDRDSRVEPHRALARGRREREVWKRVTWAADSLLTAHHFFDESKARVYVPSDYGEHGAGLFLVGVEETGKVYAFALNHESGAAALVASILDAARGRDGARARP